MTKYLNHKMLGSFLGIKKCNTLTICYKGSTLQHLPKTTQWASNEPTLTFQLYHGILLGVNLDI